MPRTARAAYGGVIYHVSNRGNRRDPLFRKPEDYQAFLELLAEGKEKKEVEIFAFCVLPDRWHLVLRPKRGKDLSAYMAWMSNTHVRRHRARNPRTSGPLYQGRYKSFPVEPDTYFLMLARYLESIPLREKRVKRAEKWQWSSLGVDPKLAEGLIDAWPVRQPRNWADLVNKPLEKREQDRIEISLDRSRPLGDDDWTIKTAQKMDLQSTMNPRGRPRKVVEE